MTSVPPPIGQDVKDPAIPVATRSSSLSSPSTNQDVEKQTPQNYTTDGNVADQENNDLTRVKSKAASEFEYPSMKKAIVILIGLYLAIFIIALDRTILGTAIPVLTNEFHSFNDIGWYQSAYMLTTGGFQLFFGRFYTFYSPKWTFITSITLFEIGSAICGAAPTSVAFIVGRAISGVGASGLMSGSMVIMLNVMPLEKRPVAIGLVGGIFGIASVVGPLLGGVFTTYVSWRWCFYINLPIGAVTIATVLLVLKVDMPMAAAGNSIREKILQLDPLGTVIFLPCLICLLLALQWGGSTYAWSDGRIIALLVLFAVLLLTFMALQVWRPENRVTVPVRIMKNRSILGGMWYTIFGGSTMIVLALYIPIWFQAIQGVDAVQSGIRNIPLILSMVIVIIFTGVMVQRVGYYTPPMIIGAVIMPIGGGLISTWKVTTGANHWIGYQVIAGIGMGFGLQQPNLAAQTVLQRKDTSIGVALIMLCQSLGGAIFASVAQNVVNNRLIHNLTATPIPGLDPKVVVSTGATQIRTLVPAGSLPQFLELYNDAITRGLLVAAATGALTFLGAIAMEWASTKKNKAPTAAKAAPVEKPLEEVESGEKTTA